MSDPVAANERVVAAEERVANVCASICAGAVAVVGEGGTELAGPPVGVLRALGLTGVTPGPCAHGLVLA
ncbi:MAG TPA: hypothetical protein VFZ97_06565 [Acidimicrobiales bacterium]